MTVANFLIIETDSDKGSLDRLTDEFSASDCTWIYFTPGEIPDLPADSTVVTYLSDASMAEVVTAAAERKWHLAVMPHPSSRNTRIGFGISRHLEEAIEDFRSAEGPRSVDLLRCNDRPVFNAVLIGDAAGLLLGIGGGVGWRERVSRFFVESRKIGSHPPAPYDIETLKNKKLSTAAVGIVVVEHGSNSLLSRQILEQSSIQDGMLHALVLAPQSWLEMLVFYFESIILHPTSSTRWPKFAGHIKASELVISSPREIPYVIDGDSATSSELKFAVTTDGLSLYPGRHLDLERDGGQGKEIYRVQSLPSPEARRELILKPLPYLRHAATDDFKELFLILRENARLSSSFLTLMVLSTLLAACGLFANSSPVIIGAMILAPLMGPIVSLSMGICRQDESLILRSLRTIGWGVLLSITCAALAAGLLPLQSITDEIAARLSPNLLDLGVAILSGIAAAYAHARQEIARSLAGVAIAVALVPPLVVAGIGVGWFNGGLFIGAFLLFLTNLVGILFAATITFSLLGFSPLTRARRGLLISLVFVAVVSVPLTFSFTQLVDSQRMARKIEGLQVGEFVVRDVVARRQAGRKVVRCHLILPGPSEPAPNATGDFQQVYQEIRTLLGEEVTIEATLMYRAES